MQELNHTKTGSTMIRRFVACLALIALSVSVQASVLSDLAASMSQKSWAQLPSSGGLSGLGLEQTLTTYANTGVWDAANDRMMWVGGPGGCCVSNPIYKMISYDAPSHQWSVVNTPYNNIGHGYDGNAFNPNNGLFYIKSWYAGIKTFNGSSWSSIPMPTSEEAAPALAYFPDANNGSGALLYVGSYGKLYAYNGSSWSQISQGQSWGSYHNIAEYNPVHKVVWIGSGSTAGASSGANRKTYKLDANLNLTALNDAPFDIQSSESGAMQVTDPISGRYLIQRRTNDTWWEFDIMNDNWSQISGMSGKPNLEAPFSVSIPELGVIMVFENYTSGPKAYLYKHTAGNIDLMAPKQPTNLSVQ